MTDSDWLRLLVSMDLSLVVFGLMCLVLAAWRSDPVAAAGAVVCLLYGRHALREDLARLRAESGEVSDGSA